MSVVKIKTGVRFDPLTPALARLLCAIDMNARMQAVDMVVSAARDSHPLGDVHTRGEAVDVSVENLTPDLILRSYNYLRTILGDVFTVLYETNATPVNGALKNIAFVNPKATGPHFHLQSKKGTTYGTMPSGALNA